MHRISEIEPKGSALLYQLKITLNWSQPAIWRRVLTLANIKLNRLHQIIQFAMPWTHSHLHQFIVGQTFYGTPNPEFGGFGRSEELNEKHYTLADLAPAAKKKIIYEYDFGDSWEHEVVVEKILPPETGFKHIVCLAGANSCPPEDCGGIHGCYRLLEVLADRKRPEHRDLKEWIGGKWDPERIDLDAINENLKRLKV